MFIDVDLVCLIDWFGVCWVIVEMLFKYYVLCCYMYLVVDVLFVVMVCEWLVVVDIGMVVMYVY